MNIPDLLDPRREIRLAPVAEREAAIVEYRVILIGVLREIQRETARSVIPRYQEEDDIRLTDGVFVVTDRESWFDSLKAVAAYAVTAAVGKMRDLFGREATSHAVRFARTVKAATGIPLVERLLSGSVVYEQLMATLIDRNASLIGSLADDAVKRVEQAVYAARMSGAARAPSIRALATTIREQLDISRRRADLIAEDQMGSLNSSLTELRASQTGFEFYVWSALPGPRTRPLHRSLHQTVQRWDTPTPAEGGLHPGGPIRCRCVAVPFRPGQADPLKKRA